MLTMMMKMVNHLPLTKLKQKKVLPCRNLNNQCLKKKSLSKKMNITKDNWIDYLWTKLQTISNRPKLSKKNGLTVFLEPFLTELLQWKTWCNKMNWKLSRTLLNNIHNSLRFCTVVSITLFSLCTFFSSSFSMVSIKILFLRCLRHT